MRFVNYFTFFGYQHIAVKAAYLMQVLHKLVNFFIALAGVVLKQGGGVKRFAIISFAGFVVAGFDEQDVNRAGKL
jgi:hypothetical protein